MNRALARVLQAGVLVLVGPSSAADADVLAVRLLDDGRHLLVGCPLVVRLEVRNRSQSTLRVARPSRLTCDPQWSAAPGAPAPPRPLEDHPLLPSEPPDVLVLPAGAAADAPLGLVEVGALGYVLPPGTYRLVVGYRPDSGVETWGVSREVAGLQMETEPIDVTVLAPTDPADRGAWPIYEAQAGRGAWLGGHARREHAVRATDLPDTAGLWRVLEQRATPTAAAVAAGIDQLPGRPEFPTGASWYDQRRWLADRLTDLVHGGPVFDEATRAALSSPPEVRALLAAGLRAEDLPRLNRRWLAEAFPNLILPTLWSLVADYPTSAYAPLARLELARLAADRGAAAQAVSLAEEFLAASAGHVWRSRAVSLRALGYAALHRRAEALAALEAPELSPEARERLRVRVEEVLARP